MAGAGFKSWVDGDILTAADVNTYLMQQAVMVFADASARTSAIAAPSEGMVTYLTGTDVIEYYDGAAWQPILDQDVIDAKGDLIVGTGDDTVGRLAVGTNGFVLTADSGETTGLKWAAAGGGSISKISATSVTNAASLSLDNVFTSTYRNYLIIGSWSGTDGAWLNIRYRASGSDDTNANYTDQSLTASNTTISGDRQTSQTAGRIAGSRNGVLNSVALWVYSPQATERTLWYSLNVDQSGTIVLANLVGVFTNTTSFDGFKVYPGSGNMTGNFAVYGIEN